MIRLLLIALSSAALAVAPQTAAKKTALTFPNGSRIQAEVVDTPAARQTGLMFRKSLPKDYGMLFVFPSEGPMQFWMKNTLVSLDIVFIRADKTVSAAHEKVPASTEATPDDKVARVGGLAQFVLELPAGTAKKRGVKAGAKLKFDATIPKY